MVYSYKNTFSENGTVVTEQNDEFGFNIPFISKKDKYNHWSLFSSGLMAGVTAMMSTPESMMGYRSVGFDFSWANILGVQYRPCRRGLALSLGFGINMNYCRLHHGVRFNRGSDKESVIVEQMRDGTSKSKSGLQSFSLLVPFNVKYDFKSGWGIGIGVWGNFTTHAFEWANYTYDDVKYNDSWSGVHRRVFRLNYVANVSYKSIGLYVKYAPKNAIKDGYGPQYKELSSGISFGF